MSKFFFFLSCSFVSFPARVWSARSAVVRLAGARKVFFSSPRRTKTATKNFLRKTSAQILFLRRLISVSFVIIVCEMSRKLCVISDGYTIYSDRIVRTVHACHEIGKIERIEKDGNLNYYISYIYSSYNKWMSRDTAFTICITM